MAAVSRTRDEVERLWWLTGVLLLVLIVAVDLALGRQINGAYAGAAVLTADQRRGAAYRQRRRPGPGGLGGLRRLARQPRLARVGGPLRHLRADLRPGRPGGPREPSADACGSSARPALAQRVLDALAVELTGARTVKEVADGFVGHAVGTLGATSAMVLTLDADDVLRTVTWHGRGGDGADQFQEVPLGSDLPGAVAAREGTDMHYRSRAEILAAFPALAGYYPTEPQPPPAAAAPRRHDVRPAGAHLPPGPRSRRPRTASCTRSRAR